MDDEEMCPICRSSRYLNPDMKFLVNPECYHKMCESCVDRIFSGGPAPCPFRGCGKILRKSRFKRQVFDDLNVEREVDVRQRVCKVFNRPEDSFRSAREYNDYLEHTETLIFTIASGSEHEREQALQEVAHYEQLHKKEILEHALKQRQEQKQQEELAALETERQRRLRLLAIELQQQEQEYEHVVQQETVASLASGRESKIVLQEAAERLKQRMDLLRQQYEQERERNWQSAAQSAKGLAGKATPRTPRTPWTPFAGDRQVPDLYDLREYYDPLIDQTSDPAVRAGGFSVAAAQRQALTLAFMGLEVDVQKEKSIMA